MITYEILSISGDSFTVKYARHGLELSVVKTFTGPAADKRTPEATMASLNANIPWLELGAPVGSDFLVVAGATPILSPSAQVLFREASAMPTFKPFNPFIRRL